MKVKQSFKVGAVAVLSLVLTFSIATSAAAVGYLRWNTSPSGGYVDKSQDGCKARGVSISGESMASTFWVDSYANSGYQCATVGVRVFAYAGVQSAWTPWKYSVITATTTKSNILNAQHQLLTETNR